MSQTILERVQTDSKRPNEPENRRCAQIRNPSRIRSCTKSLLHLIIFHINYFRCGEFANGVETIEKRFLWNGNVCGAAVVCVSVCLCGKKWCIVNGIFVHVVFLISFAPVDSGSERATEWDGTLCIWFSEIDDNFWWFANVIRTLNERITFRYLWLFLLARTLWHFMDFSPLLNAKSQCRFS